MRTLFILIFFTAVTTAHGAATLVCDNATYAEVNSKLTAASAGDTIEIPAGDETWTSALSVNKAVTFRGAGIGQTIIRKATSNQITWGSNVTAKVFGISFYNSTNSTSANILSLRGPNNVIGDCHFEGTVTKITGILASGGSTVIHPTGVVYGCYFKNARAHMQGDLNSSTPGYFGRKIWANTDQVSEIGSANTMFFEDCTFERTVDVGKNMMDAEYGGHYVVRHSTFIDCSVFGHGASGPGERGTKFIECYDNAFTYLGVLSQDPPFWIRSGSAVVYNNTIGSHDASADLLVSMEIEHYGGSGISYSGTHNGSTGDTALTDSTATFPSPNGLMARVVHNDTSGAKGIVLGNTATVITISLQGGSRTTWTAGDTYRITNGYEFDGNTALADGTGTHTGSANASTLTDSSQAWTTNAYVGVYVWNTTDSSLGIITANTATTITATLLYGTENDWDNGDTYKITNGYPWRDLIGRGTDVSLWGNTTFTAPEQVLSPIYEWNNTQNGTPTHWTIGQATLGASLTQWLTENVDYYNSTEKPGYTAYTYPHPLREDTEEPTALSITNTKRNRSAITSGF